MKLHFPLWGSMLLLSIQCARAAETGSTALLVTNSSTAVPKKNTNDSVQDAVIPEASSPRPSSLIVTTSEPSGSPTAILSPPPTAFVLEPVPALEWHDMASIDRSSVEKRCLDILNSLTDTVWPMPSYWEPNVTVPLYFSAAEGDDNRTIAGFTPEELWALSAPSSTMGLLLTTVGGATASPGLIFSSARSTTPVDVSGRVCSMSLAVTFPTDCGNEISKGNIAMDVRSMLELNENGRLVKWINTLDAVALDTAVSKACGTESSISGEDPAVTAIKRSCMASFEMIFPPMGQSLTSLFGIANLFSNANLSFPEGNDEMTTRDISSGWAAFAFFMHKLNPFVTPTIARTTSPIDVTGNVCSFDQELIVTFPKAIAVACPPLYIPGRVLMEMGPAPAESDTVMPPPVVRLLSQFDNETFWGGIENCTETVKAAKADAKAKKKAEKAERKRQKEEANALRKAEKEAEEANKKERSGSISLMVDWIGGNDTAVVPLIIEVMIGVVLGVWAVVLAAHHLREYRRRVGYLSIGETDDEGTKEERATLLTV